MRWVVRALTVLFVLCLSALAAVVYERLRPGHVVERPSVALNDAAPAESLGQFSPLDPPQPAPAVSFTSEDGKSVALTAFRGRVVLINLWATWCAPCIKEMPSLQRLQAKLGTGLGIVAVSEDRNVAAVGPFLTKHELESLAIYLDPKDDLSQAFGVRGLPTSYLIDRDGRILGQLEGAAEWDSPTMVALIEKYLQPSQ
jgi:thiol-disulfide isomerase/thioredoxin